MPEKKEPACPILARRKARLFCTGRLIDVVHATEDGSVGVTGRVTAAFDPLLTDIDLGKPVTIGRYPGTPLGEAMAKMLEHQRGHLEDLRTSLHAHPAQ